MAAPESSDREEHDRPGGLSAIHVGQRRVRIRASELHRFVGIEPPAGRFRTRGRYSAATVRGTAWTMSDRCDGTLVTVRRDTVSVQDFVRHVTVLVRAGHRCLAKAPGARRR